MDFKNNHIVKNRLLLLPYFLFILSFQINAQTEFTGFVDVLHSYSLSTNRSIGFQMNQFEIDIAHSLNSKLSLGAAIAFDNKSQNMKLSLANIHYNIWGNETYHPRNEEKFGHLAINIGLNDTPFGLDYLLLASHDRTVISKPIVVEKTIDGWNDIGINLHGIISIFNFDFNIVNGFNNGINIGGKLNVKPFNIFCFGISYASDFASMNNQNNWITGIDFILGNDNIKIKSEYLWASGLLDGEQYIFGTDIKSNGYYIQAIIKTEKYLQLPFFLTLRLGNWESNIDTNYNGTLDSQNRFSLGIGYQMMRSFSIRSEFLFEKDEHNKTDKSIAIQAVVNF